MKGWGITGIVAAGALVIAGVVVATVMVSKQDKTKPVAGI